MKRLILISIALFLIASCNTEKQKSVATISGKVNNDLRKVEFLYFKENTADMNLTPHIAKVDSLGCFSIEIPIQTISKGVMLFNKLRYDLVLSSNDNLEIVINKDSVIYSGKGSQKNIFLNKIGKNSNQFALMRSWYMKEHNLEEMYQMLEDFISIREKEIKKFKGNSNFDKEFVSFFEKETKITYLSLLMQVPSIYSRVNRLPVDSVRVPKKFDKNITINSTMNDEYLVCKDYINLLNKIVRKQIGKLTALDSSLTRKEAKLAIIMDSLKGKTREHYLVNDIYNSLIFSDYYDSLTIAAFKSISIDENCKNTINNKIAIFNTKKAMLGKPLNEDILGTVIYDTANVKMTLGNVINKFKGKVIYLDTWSLHCGPCRIAMPLSKKLKDKLVDEPIEFVYITVDKEDDKLWAEVFKVSQSTKNHYRFEKEFNSKLHESFSIRAVPTYLLINKQGNLVSYDAERPYNMRMQENPRLEKILIELAHK